MAWSVFNIIWPQFSMNWPSILPAKAHFNRCLPHLLLIVPLTLVLTWCWLLLDDTWTKVFCTLFALRYTRLVVHVLGSWMYRPSEVQPDPAFGRGDVTVILPTIDPNGPDFRECVESILMNRPTAILVVTVGEELRGECERVLQEMRDDFVDVRIGVSALAEASKRRQVTHAVSKIETAITVLADDHVIWKDSFLPSVLAPFNDQSVGMVATKKRVRRTTPGQWTWLSIVNFIACNYLQRHNWELRTSNAIDGGVFVISGRTAVYRTEFLNDATMLERFCAEKFFFCLLGGNGLGPDDDNFLTRDAMKKNWRIKFQDTEDATIETTLGEWPKFQGQLLRWARTTFRSNPVMLRDPVWLLRYPWSAFMVYWAGLINFALLWDFSLIFTVVKSGTRPANVMLLLIWMFWTKVVKIIPHFCQHPSDFSLVIFQILFGYVHSFIKLWALLTFWDCDWSGRNLEDVNAEGERPQLDTSFHSI
ncbi:hypothetical protein NM208_g1492 [Fusarium decemcellulare]|uniref:Uncharacterized protein n=1 Tax=Fusarium decemcellulare TaxID=57161 RepID=A0ACC1SWH3_9HYPO|nr:hypothetical protein NM208_g1492 [Fusarium decemcellulare]